MNEDTDNLFKEIATKIKERHDKKKDKTPNTFTHLRWLQN